MSRKSNARLAPPVAERPSILDVLFSGRMLSVPLAVEMCAVRDSETGAPYVLALDILEGLARQGVCVRVPSNAYSPVRYVLAPEYRLDVRTPPVAVLAL